MHDAYAWLRPFGATVLDDGLVEVRAWAPGRERVAARVGGVEHPLGDEGFGVHAGRVPGGDGDDYELVLDGERWPDPHSRWQPHGLRGPSRIVDVRAFAWTDGGWRAPDPADVVLYELHVGAFTQEGTFAAAIEHLPALRELGVTAIELMPVAEFPGARGWGYDGVYLRAAQSSYGGPHELARLVDAAHANGLAVVLDVVLNHVGASGVAALEAFGPYFTDRYETPWGRAINYDDACSDPVREWALQAVEGWVRDFHLDGVRLDAIHAIYDAGARPILREVAERVHAADPRALVIAESGRNDPVVIRPAAVGGLGHDAAWADDFHHALRALLTGERDGWYEEFGFAAQLAKAFRRPHVHDGGYSTFRRRRFGAPADDRPVEQFVVFSQNHDQVGNRALGDRLPDEAAALAAFATLLSPFTPMLFMGEEHGEPAPFQFFSDHVDEEIATATREGRRREFAAFAAFAGVDVPDPQDPATFERSKLTRAERPGRRALYAELLRWRRELPRGDVDDVAFDDDMGGPWLRVRRGEFTLAMNFADGPLSLAVDGGEVLLATSDAVAEGGRVLLAPRSGALIR